MIPQIQHLPDGAVDLNFPYHAGLVSRLKSEIPAYARTYDPLSKTWTVHASYAARAVALMRASFLVVTEYGDDRSAPPPPQPIRQKDQDFAVLHLLPSAPPALIEAAFRCLSKELHPDRGGQHEAMIQLNETMSALRGRRGVA
jgi:hypothetical protein